MLGNVLIKLDDVFELPVQRMPGAFFIGAMFFAPRLAHEMHDPAPIGVGGRGFSRESALASCMGEAAELITYLERREDPRLVKFQASLAPPEDIRAWAYQGAGLDPSVPFSKLDWIEIKGFGGNSRFLLPAELILKRPAAHRQGHRLVETNGLGAQNDLRGALMSGLLEVIERDAFALWWHGGAVGYRFAEDDPILADLRAKSAALRVAPDREWWLLDITTDLGIPAVVCLSSGTGGDSVIAGFGAALRLSHAAQSAFLEMCQMEFAQEHAVATSGKKNRNELKLLDQKWLARHRDLTLARCPQFLGLLHERRQISHRNFDSGLEVIERLNDLGFPVFWVDLTRQDLSVPVVKVLVPGLQSPNADWQSSRLKATAFANGYDIEHSLSQAAPI